MISPLRWLTIHNPALILRRPSRKWVGPVGCFSTQLQSQWSDALRFDGAHNVEHIGRLLRAFFEFKGQCRRIVTYFVAPELNQDVVAVTWEQRATSEMLITSIQVSCIPFYSWNKSWLTWDRHHLDWVAEASVWSLLVRRTASGIWASTAECSRWRRRLLVRCFSHSA